MIRVAPAGLRWRSRSAGVLRLGPRRVGQRRRASWERRSEIPDQVRDDGIFGPGRRRGVWRMDESVGLDVDAIYRMVAIGCAALVADRQKDHVEVMAIADSFLEY